MLGTPEARNCASNMPPWQWWQMFGHEVPELQVTSMRVVARTGGATASERIWSAHGHVHNPKQCLDLTAPRAPPPSPPPQQQRIDCVYLDLSLGHSLDAQGADISSVA